MDYQTVQWDINRLEPLIKAVKDSLADGGIDQGVREISDFINMEHWEFTTGAFREAGFSIYKWMHHISLRKAGAEDEWLEDFPHTHGWPNSVTMVQFLQAPDAGGELVIMPVGEKVIEITPRDGLCAFCDGETEHGVRPVIGDIDRISLMVTGWYH